MSKNLSIDFILVPKGQEYKAVCRGLKGLDKKPKIIAIPIGGEAVKHFLESYKLKESRILLMGLAGSLSPNNKIKDTVIYQQCIDLVSGKSYDTDSKFTQEIREKLKTKIVTGLTSDRLIWLAEEKQNLGQQTQTDVVDMEGSSILATLDPQKYSVGIVRVISDDCYTDLPDISQAIAANGSLKPFSLAISFFKQPLAAWRLIRGSLSSLKVLEQVTRDLLSPT